MSYDASFAHTKLSQLTEQLLSGTYISGDILFIADDEDGGVLGSTWIFEDEDSGLLKERNYKFMLMELLDDLIRYRASHNYTGSLCGVVRLNNSKADLQWMPEGDVQKLRGAD